MKSFVYNGQPGRVVFGAGALARLRPPCCGLPWPATPRAHPRPCAALALQNQYPNPRPLERTALRHLLQDAFEGNPPELP
ncbi:MAG TPA: hypothetical protein VFM98_10900 [Ramlibacter sp.]|uniref:hypothetical protein n=1 Tax=Ramlibacter sp. TaxID=1917967 RepID=UPI002D7FB093|nr:hypothetical protein [Ramlibacter sp.]HET8746103.1 hypothetical protein [Ramlibacter sp.]